MIIKISKLLTLTALLSFLFISCNQEFDCLQQPDTTDLDQAMIAEDVNQIKQYLDSLEIDYSEDPSGLIYTVNEEGEGETPTFCNSVLATVQARIFKSDSIYDQGFDRNLNLRSQIVGLQIGITQMNRGSDYKFYIPSELAYAENGICNSDGTDCVVPPNTIIEYRVLLKNFSTR